MSAGFLVKSLQSNSTVESNLSKTTSHAHMFLPQILETYNPHAYFGA